MVSRYANQTYCSLTRHASVCNTFHKPSITSIIDVKKTTTWGESGFPSEFLGGVTDADGVIALSVGSNGITIEVTAEDGETSLTYTITVTRAPTPTTHATLRPLLLSGVDIGSGMGTGTIVPSDTSYTASVYHSVSQTTITPTVNHSGASYVIKLGGVEDADGTISLAVGSNVITVEVTAEDTTTTKTYTVTVNRATASAPTTGELSTDDPSVNFRTITITHDHAIYSFNFPRNRGIFGWVMQRYERSRRPEGRSPAAGSGGTRPTTPDS